ncbi:MAG: pilus assembly protein [Bacilli bacterium]|nr:pilus assembly protein [Bacilli bacterium]
MNRKGQALIEFVLILPVFILILFAIVDFGNIFQSKYELQNQSTDIIRLIQNGTNITEVTQTYSKLNVEINTYQDDYQKITITKEVALITPLMDKVLGNPYLIEVERIVPNA